MRRLLDARQAAGLALAQMLLPLFLQLQHPLRRHVYRLDLALDHDAISIFQFWPLRFVGLSFRKLTLPLPDDYPDVTGTIPS